MKNHRMYCLFVAMLLSLFGAACRSEDQSYSQETHEDSPQPDQGSGKEQPDGSNGPWQPGSINFIPAPEQSSSGNGPSYQEYVTEMRIVTGCGVDDPDTVSVAKNHAAASGCERISVTLLRNDDGDLYEVAAPVQWSITNVQAVSLNCLNGPQDDLCHLLGHQDSFDTDPEGDSEPMTDLNICALNSCPTPQPADCEPKICMSLSVASVVNIEGTWVFNPNMMPPGQSVSILQDGRSFSDAWVGIKNGLVQGKAVSFELDDYIYLGQFYPDRNHMTGVVIDQLNNNSVLGNWTAVRIP